MSVKHGTNRFFPRANEGGEGLWMLYDPDVVGLVNTANKVAIGATAMGGTEKLRIVGGVRIDDATSLAAYVELRQGSVAAVSPAGSGRIRYNETLSRLEASENGGAYFPLAAPAAGGWIDDGAIVHTVTATDAVVIGAAALVGTERFRLTGGTALFDFTSTTALQVAQTGGGSPALVVDTTNTRVGIGTAPGAFTLDVNGNTRVTGKLTVTGSIDPTDLTLSGGTAQFIQWGAGSTAPLSAATTMRVRYEEGTNVAQISLNGAAYVTLATSSGNAPLDAPYLTNGAVTGLTAEVNVQALTAALAFQGNAIGAPLITFTREEATNSTVLEAVSIRRSSSAGAGANGIGASVGLYGETTTAGTFGQAVLFEGTLTDAIVGSLTGTLGIVTPSGAATAVRVLVDGPGHMLLGDNITLPANNPRLAIKSMSAGDLALHIEAPDAGAASDTLCRMIDQANATKFEMRVNGNSAFGSTASGNSAVKAQITGGGSAMRRGVNGIGQLNGSCTVANGQSVYGAELEAQALASGGDSDGTDLVGVFCGVVGYAKQQSTDVAGHTGDFAGAFGVAEHDAGGALGTIANAIGVKGRYGWSSNVTLSPAITNGIALLAAVPVRSAGTGTATTGFGLKVRNQGAAFVTTAIGIDVDAISGSATNIGIRTQTGVIVGTAAFLGAELVRLAGVSVVDVTSTTAFRVGNATLLATTLTVDTTNNRVGIGAAPGAFTLDVTGDTRITGKLTVTGAIDPTSLTLSGGTAQYIQWGAGSTAAVSDATSMRIRYEEGSNVAQISFNGATYVTLATSAGGAPADAAYLTNGSVAGLSNEVNVQSHATPLFFQPSANSSTAWQLRDAAGNVLLDSDTTNFRIGVGTNAPSGTFHVSRTALAGDASTDNICRIDATISSGVDTGVLNALRSEASLSDGATGTAIRSGSFLATTSSTSTLGTMVGVNAASQAKGAGVAVGAVTSAQAISAVVGFDTSDLPTSGQLTEAIGLAIASPTGTSGARTIPTLKGINISNLGATGVTDAFAIDIAAQSGAATTNIGIRTQAPVVVANTAMSGSEALRISGGGVLMDGNAFTISALVSLAINNAGGAISIGNNADAQAINIGTGGAARTITVGNSTGATSLVLDCGTGALNVGTNAIAHTISIGNQIGASALTLDAGTGTVNIAAGAQARTTNIATGAAAQTVTLGSMTGASSMRIDAGTGTLGIGASASARTVNIATGAAAQTVTVGSTNGASSMTIDMGTGVLNVGTSASARTSSICTGAAVQTVTLGSTNTTSTLTLQCGNSASSSTPVVNLAGARTTMTPTAFNFVNASALQAFRFLSPANTQLFNNTYTAFHVDGSANALEFFQPTTANAYVLRVTGTTYNSNQAGGVLPLAATVQIDGPPVAGTNMTITAIAATTGAYALNCAGASRFTAGLYIRSATGLINTDSSGNGIIFEQTSGTNHRFTITGTTTSIDTNATWTFAAGWNITHSLGSAANWAFTSASVGRLTGTQTAAGSGTPTGVTWTYAAHTGLSGAEMSDLVVNMARTVTFSSGLATVATQRAALFQAPTYANSGGGTLTFTDAATVAITGAPATSGGNITLTTSYALWVQAGNSRFAGGILITATAGLGANVHSELDPASQNYNVGVNVLQNIDPASGYKSIVPAFWTLPPKVGNVQPGIRFTFSDGSTVDDENTNAGASKTVRREDFAFNKNGFTITRVSFFGDNVSGGAETQDLGLFTFEAEQY